jgi:SAM-dependent methyltransferase
MNEPLTSEECAQMVLPAVLDACCGSRMMWFDKTDPRALFIDNREETHLIDGRAPLVISPDTVADFTAMPFPDESFCLVVFDPPHINASRAGKNGSRFTKFYGMLPNDWQGLLRAGFAECFRVLKPSGTLVFKWSERCYPLREILALTPHKPLFGNRATSATHWCVFMKDAA